MKAPFLDLYRQVEKYRKDIDENISDVLNNTQFILGRYVEELEARMCDALGVKHALGCSSGTDALYIALKSLGAGEGDEIITTPFTFFATAASIARTGARPVFADIDPDTYNLDIGKVEDAITENTRGIVPVHLFGQPADMDPFVELARDKDLFILEDTAQAVGAKYKGKTAGTIGDAGILSFYPTKNLSAAGDAGMVLTGRDDVIERAGLYRNHGSKDAVEYDVLGGICGRMDGFQAAVILAKLGHLGEINERRSEIAAFYDDEFKNLPLELPPKPVDGYEPVYHQYTISHDDRDGLRAYLAENGVGTAVYYAKTLNTQKCFSRFSPASCPVAEKAVSRVLQLPIFPELTDGETETVARAVKSYFDG